MQHSDELPICIANLTVDGSAAIPMHRQLSDALRRAIIEETLAAKQTLPSIRDLAQATGISRSTVLRSLEDLESQGYIVMNPGSGCCVADHLPGDISDMDEPFGGAVQLSQGNQNLRLSSYGERLLTMGSDTSVDFLKQLNHGGPALDLSPIQQWRDIFRRHCRLRDADKLESAREPFGFPPLREAYAAYLTRARAVRCTKEQVAVFFARELRLDLILRLWLNVGDSVAVENPGYPGARQRFAAHGANVVPIPVDSAGMSVEHLVALPERFKFVYVTPSHQEPTGGVMPLSRRRKLLNWAKETGALIIEDDYDSEFRYASCPIPSLQGLEDGSPVIHLSCLWKTLSPVVKIGFMVVPNQLTTMLTQAKELVERDVPFIDQFALTDFINEGYLERHIRKARKIYAVRRQTLVQALSQHFGKRVVMSIESAGMDLLVRLDTTADDETLQALGKEAGLIITSSQPYYVGKGRQGEFVIPFSLLSEDQIRQGVKKFALSLSQ